MGQSELHVWQLPAKTAGHDFDQAHHLQSNRDHRLGYGVWSDDSAKNQWLIDAFTYLAGQAQVRGLIYYNIQGWEVIDWPVHLNGALTDYTGYQTGASNPAYRYIAPAELKNMPLLP